MSGEQEVNYDNEAREMGWVEKEQFRGDPEKWVDSKTFIERGEHFLPMLRANNKRLKDDLLTRTKEIDSLKQTVSDVQKAMAIMRTHYDESVKQQVAQAKKDLAGQIKQAREDGDTDLEIELLDQLSDIKQTEKEAKETARETPDDKSKNIGSGEKTQHQLEFEEWGKKNTWFGGESREDQRRTQLLIRVGQDLRFEGDTTAGQEFIDKCLQRLKEQEEGTGTKRQSSKVESGDGRGKGSSSRGFDGLSKEAKDICHADNEKFVGNSKMFKTVKEWEDYFYKQVEGQE